MSTNATTPRIIWIHDATVAAIAAGVDAEWLREPAQATRLARYYTMGETLADAVAMLRAFWAGKLRADREDADGFSHIRAAARVARRVQ